MSEKQSPLSPHPDLPDFARQIDWNLFALFYEIVRAGGIGAAARRLNRQQPTISAGLKRLEDQLGVELLRRTSTGVEPVPAGRALFELCETMMGSVRCVPHEVAKAAGIVEGVIHVRMISSLVAPAFDEALSAFHASHPGVEIHLEVTPWRDVIKALKSGEAEVGIACDHAPSRELRYTPLIKEVQQLYCGPGHPLYGKTIRHPADLENEAYIQTGDDEPDELLRFRHRYGIGQRTGGFAENLHEVKRLIERGIGIGFLPTCVAETLDQGQTLWPLVSEDLLPDYHVFLITRGEPARNTPTEFFLDEIMSHLSLPAPTPR